MLRHLRFVGILAGMFCLSNTIFCDTEIKYDNGSMSTFHYWSVS
ncbi:MAG: hypothetical protein PHX21_02675 [bacterium]|nr:hypothetical protein [bacterium]